MFSKFLNILLFLVLSASLVMLPVANASDVMEAGTVLEEDSLVFTLEEGDDLRKRIEELELVEKKALVLEDLVSVQDLEITEFKALSEAQSLRIEGLQSLSDLHQDRVETLERHEKYNDLTKAGWFVLGALLTGGAIYLGDQIGDNMESN
tara:strand:+ start:543 stop:992 length:450 start_codon:yes stop_codon:yes gene_type:complete